MLKKILPVFSLESETEKLEKDLLAWANDEIDKCKSDVNRKEALQNILAEINASRAANKLDLRKIAAFELELSSLQIRSNKPILQSEINESSLYPEMPMQSSSSARIAEELMTNAATKAKEKENKVVINQVIHTVSEDDIEPQLEEFKKELREVKSMLQKEVRNKKNPLVESRLKEVQSVFNDFIHNKSNITTFEHLTKYKTKLLLARKYNPASEKSTNLSKLPSPPKKKPVIEETKEVKKAALAK